MVLKSERKLRHLAVIMDGNGRWAKQRGLERLEGHKAGADAVRRLLEMIGDFGIEYLTLYAFSTENWKRPQEEVDGLMELLKEFLHLHHEDLMKNRLRLRAIGRIEQLPPATNQALQDEMIATANNTGGTLVLALNYGGRAEIVDAAQKIARAAVDGKLNLSELDENRFSEYLYAPDIPDPDLMIRTSGEMRLSNFLLWQLSYSELYITDKLWPDFDREEMTRAVDSFYHRERRYGGTVS